MGLAPCKLTFMLPPLYPIIDFSSFASRPDPISAILSYAEELLEARVKLIQLRDKSLLEPGQVNATRRFLSCARELRRVTSDKVTLIINDRVDLCLASDADGVHLGQDDLSPEAARKIFDSIPTRTIAESMEQQMLERAALANVENMNEKQRVRFFEIEPHRLKRRIVGQIQRKSELLGEELNEENLDAIYQKKLIGFSTHNLTQVREADALPVGYIAIGPVFATGSKANPDPVVGIEGVRQARAATKKPLVAIGGITRLNCRQVRDAGADSVAVISDLLESPGKAVADFLRVLG
jgi:thiamine monophosphate synthase